MSAPAERRAPHIATAFNAAEREFVGALDEAGIIGPVLVWAMLEQPSTGRRQQILAGVSPGRAEYIRNLAPDDAAHLAASLRAAAAALDPEPMSRVRLRLQQLRDTIASENGTRATALTGIDAMLTDPGIAG